MIDPAATSGFDLGLVSPCCHPLLYFIPMCHKLSDHGDDQTPSASPTCPPHASKQHPTGLGGKLWTTMGGGLEAGFNPWPWFHASSPSLQLLSRSSLLTKLRCSEHGLHLQPLTQLKLLLRHLPLPHPSSPMPPAFLSHNPENAFFFLLVFKSCLIVPGRMGRASDRTIQMPFSQDVRWSSQGRKMLTVGFPQQAALCSSHSLPLPSRLSC